MNSQRKSNQDIRIVWCYSWNLIARRLWDNHACCSSTGHESRLDGCKTRSRDWTKHGPMVTCDRAKGTKGAKGAAGTPSQHQSHRREQVTRHGHSQEYTHSADGARPVDDIPSLCGFGGLRRWLGRVHPFCVRQSTEYAMSRTLCHSHRWMKHDLRRYGKC
ncbi:hypothetical protein VFPPC_18763 [Pochonia chlamydosporia 170]|uniref:Uncharacterized protein n=1 Tax=Pochonia chlamydosporia 170 TaxID=1380566 RepID=A0A219ARW8_METCM|nr:hypothetical protein VFPPC_18763 [Pochonia chlamydosporia 170]OWT43510.1 hypothetical protein VFPPC_18763 [Pochonia chlamydosporia 170]